jgi:hypothetical protein
VQDFAKIFFVAFVFLIFSLTSYLVGSSVTELVAWLFFGLSKDNGSATDHQFSDQPHITAYIPQMVQVSGLLQSTNRYSMLLIVQVSGLLQSINRLDIACY